ncbi:hypothetical protein FHS19_001695 [Paenibacillus rhizosphaerae]|uniref:Glycosyl hydrolase family 43 n=1 Tax=Paenibacillus rhizosphaerae TaxID=297318 RepID=A0A839TK54_9BACL|nr:glycoside hydrolase family 43 protein [Paenibacillus rhizosphaerae]MBB3127041.1 hypothetical protein [Paenibacillus rhizosphaerae]
METNTFFKPGQIWPDLEGNPIRSHGGGILKDNGAYYWFGEKRDGFITFPGISCYRSTDLLNWERLDDALKPVEEDGHDLHPNRIVERPKVIRNPRTGQYVMWMHIENKDYSLAHAGVAVSDRPEGPYQYISSCRPNDEESRDMTLYQDDDGSAYLIHASENNQTLHINLLSDDYLSMEGKWTQACEGLYREAPAVFKHRDTYYLIASGCTGFSPNASYYAVADSMLGEWKIQGSIARGTGAANTFYSQPTFALPVEDKNIVILMGDRWRFPNLSDTRHVWLPMIFEENGLAIEWFDEWNFEERTPGVYVDKAEGPIKPVNYFCAAQKNDETDQFMLDQGDTDELKVVASLGWSENSLQVNLRLEGEPLHLYNSKERIWEQDHIWISIGHFQFSFALLQDGSCYAVPGTHLDQLGMGTFFSSEATKHMCGHWLHTEGGFQVVLSIGRQAAPLPELSTGTELPVSIAVVRHTVSHNKKARVFAPAGWVWGDPRTYFRAVLQYHSNTKECLLCRQ